MMTVVTYVTLRDGDEPEWDQAMRERLKNARGREGWIGGQILMALDSPNRRAIIGTWRTRADWEAWHDDESFHATRERLEGLETETNHTSWFEVLTDIRPGAGETR